MWTCGVPQHPRLALQSRDRERPLVSPTLFPIPYFFLGAALRY